MRKSFCSLSGIVTNEMGMNIQDGDAFIFVNRPCTSMKVLHMECGGLVIYHLKLERGCPVLPSNLLETKEAMEAKRSDSVMMVEGISPDHVKRATRWKPNKCQCSKVENPEKDKAVQLLIWLILVPLQRNKCKENMPEESARDKEIICKLQNKPDEKHREISKLETKLAELQNAQGMQDSYEAKLKGKYAIIDGLNRQMTGKGTYTGWLKRRVFGAGCRRKAPARLANFPSVLVILG